MTSTAATDLYWSKFEASLVQACSLFGFPEALAQRMWLTRRAHRNICAFLRRLEALLRQLIFSAALAHAPMTLPPRPERKYQRRLGMPAHAGAYFDETQPHTWRVAFKLSASWTAGAPAGTGASAAFDKLRQAPSPNNAYGSARLSRAQRVSKAARPHISSAPCAQRLEALIRAFNNRDKLAAAVARKIARKAEIETSPIERTSIEPAPQAPYAPAFQIISREEALRMLDEYDTS